MGRDPEGLDQWTFFPGTVKMAENEYPVDIAVGSTH
jgi:hypothetical protein